MSKTYHGFGSVWLVDLSTRAERQLAETSAFSLSVSSDTAVRLDTLGGPLFAADAAVVSHAETIQIVSNTVWVQTLALLFGLDAAAQLAGASPAVDQFGAQASGAWLQVGGYPRAMGSLTVTFANEGAPVEGTHYEADLARGRVQVLQGSLGSVTVSYSPSGVVDGVPGVVQTRSGRTALRLLGENRACGSPLDVYVGECVLSAAGPVDLKGVWASLSLEATVLNRSLVVSGR